VGPRDMRMYYHSFDAAAGRWTVGVATSADGFKWAKRGPVFAGGGDGAAFDARGAAARHVVRDFSSRRCAGRAHNARHGPAVPVSAAARRLSAQLSVGPGLERDAPVSKRRRPAQVRDVL
jgi:hypothetical protein